MVILILAFCIVAVIVVFSAVYYRSGTVQKQWAWVLWCIRLAVATLLLCALFEPVFHVRTLSLGPQPIAVLIDASQSMKLFKPDSLIARVVSALNASVSAKGGALPPPEVFLFGDSLRRCANPSNISFSDRHSFFPSLTGEKNAGRSRFIVVVSDGNWSNPTPSLSALRNKSCWYVGLPAFSPCPLLHAQCAGFASTVAQDSPFIATLWVRGFKSNADPLEIAVREKGRTVAAGLLKAGAGYFGDTVRVQLPSSKPGRHLFTVDIVNAPDGLRRQLYLLGTVAGGKFTAAIRSVSPSLDRRFISLALSDGAQWNVDDGAAPRGVDVLFILDWDAEARKAFSRIKPSGAAVFVGCAPCSTAVLIPPDSLTLKAAAPDDTLALSLQRMKLPAPVLISPTPPSALGSINSLITCRVNRAPAGGKLRDCEVPFLFSASFEGRSALFLAARDVWKLEFLPLAVGRENENPSFIRCFLAFVRRMVYANVNQTFFAFPASEELCDGDSCIFGFDAPSRPIDGSASSAPATIRFSATGNGAMLADTIMTLNGGNDRPTPSIPGLRLKPFPAGAVAFTARYESGPLRLVSADTLFVQKSEAENELQGQNTFMLDQIASALSPGDIRGIADAALRDWQGEKRDTRTLTLRIEQSWPLFLAIICLLTAEWVLRRKIGLDG